MSSESFTILVSSAGRRVELQNIWRTAIANVGRCPRVIAADASRISAAFQGADVGYQVPPCKDPNFVPELLNICRRERVSLIVPTIDPELPIYASARAEFEAVGTRVHVSSAATISIANDKRATHRWLVDNGIPTVRQSEAVDVLQGATDLHWPLIAKPAFGSSSTGVAKVGDMDALRHLVGTRTDYIVQELAPGVEYTVDVLVSGNGRSACAVPRRRIEVRAGEVSKALTVRHSHAIAVAERVAECLPGAWGCINVQMFVDDTSGRISVIEINPRFGGGFPLTWEAGGLYPRWILEEMLGLPSTVTHEWIDGLVMLRYDAAVFRSKESCGL